MVLGWWGSAKMKSLFSFYYNAFCVKFRKLFHNILHQKYVYICEQTNLSLPDQLIHAG